MASRPLPRPVLWFVIAFDLVIAALALGLYAGLIPRSHPVLAGLPTAAYLLVALVSFASAALMVFLQTRTRAR